MEPSLSLNNPKASGPRPQVSALRAAFSGRSAGAGGRWHASESLDPMVTIRTALPSPILSRPAGRLRSSEALKHKPLNSAVSEQGRSDRQDRRLSGRVRLDGAGDGGG